MVKIIPLDDSSLKCVYIPSHLSIVIFLFSFSVVSIWIWIHLAWQTALAATVPKLKLNSSSHPHITDIIHSSHKPLRHDTLIAEKKSFPYPSSRQHPFPSTSWEYESYFRHDFKCEKIFLQTSRGSFYNPGYPVSIRNNTSCSWYIGIKSQEILTLRLEE